MATLTSAILAQCLYMIADATAGEINIPADAAHPFCGEMLEAIIEIIIVCVVFCITTTLYKRAGSLKIPTKRPEPTRADGLNASEARNSENSYNAALQKQADIGNVSGCANLCKEMRARNIEPSETTFLILLQACINAEDFERACSILEDLRQTGTPFCSARFLHCVRNLVDIGRVDEARQLLEKLAPTPPSIFHSMLKAYARLGDRIGWVQTFNLALRSGVQLDGSAVEVTLVSFQSMPKRGQDAVSIFEDLIKHGLQPSQDIFSVVLTSLSKSGAWEAALKFLGGIQSRFGMRPEVCLYEQLAFACAKSGDDTSMMSIYSAMREAVPAATDEGNRWFKSERPRSQASPCSWRASTTSGATAESSQRDRLAATQHTEGKPRLSRRLNQFIAFNRLDDQCAQMLRRMPSAQSDWVMDQEFIIQVDPTKTSSSMVLNTILRSQSKCDEFWSTYPTNFDLAKRFSEFLHINQLDMRCTKTLENLSPECRQWVMDQEFIIQVDPAKGTASAKVIGQVLKLRSGQ